MFGKKDLEAGEAVIVENHIKHHGGGQGQSNLREWVADVRPVHGQTFRAVIQTPNLALDFREPVVGDVVRVLIDPKSGKVKFDKSDPRISLKAARAQKQARFEEAAAGQPGSVAELRQQAAPPSVAERLSALQLLKDTGVLTDEEYDEQRQRIIGSI
jgi:hypothetical protein